MEKEQAIQLADEVTDIYIDMEYEILMNIATLLSQKKELLETDPDAWKVQQANNLGLLTQRNLEIIRANSGLTNNQLNYLLWQAGVIALEPSEVALMKAASAGVPLIVPVAVAATPTLVSILYAFQQQAISTLNLVNSTMLSQANQIYLDIINRTAADVLAGTKTMYQALRSTISQWAENGIPALIDRRGRKWGTEGYVRTVLTSTIGNVANQMQDERFKQWGVTLVEVSSHLGARPKCAPYQGKIYTIADDPGYPHLYNDTSYGDPAGLFGINCGHNKYAFVKGQSTQRYYPYPKERNEKVYEQSQRQRLLERNIRKAKTRKALLEEIGDSEGVKQANVILRRRQQAMRDFIEETGRTRRRDREQIIVEKPKAKPLQPDNPLK